MTLMGIVQGYGGLIATRFFLGLTEAPFFPGAMFILSNWYRREELQRRISYLYAVCTLFVRVQAAGADSFDLVFRVLQ